MPSANQAGGRGLRRGLANSFYRRRQRRGCGLLLHHTAGSCRWRRWQDRRRRDRHGGRLDRRCRCRHRHPGRRLTQPRRAWLGGRWRAGSAHGAAPARHGRVARLGVGRRRHGGQDDAGRPVAHGPAQRHVDGTPHPQPLLRRAAWRVAQQQHQPDMQQQRQRHALRQRGGRCLGPRHQTGGQRQILQDGVHEGRHLGSGVCACQCRSVHSGAAKLDETTLKLAATRLGSNAAHAGTHAGTHAGAHAGHTPLERPS